MNLFKVSMQCSFWLVWALHDLFASTQNYNEKKRGNMKQRNNSKTDLESAKSALKSAIENKDPMRKWLPILNEMKEEIDNAKANKISVNQIRKILVGSGIEVPYSILKKFMGIN